ncbi:hypothetical protein OIDMADRAFT_38068 [Oidiodendron maius Zn]|uniref:Uncharacterized protein n=1 Tax=Oidiodendron maius (strain Zn) TaxID=913774 RepID=A0A0C3HR89_OIDMZ|nr:hypothetical protein OIDMADRAFT_38068 [Oidiodendron maius Zn]
MEQTTARLRKTFHYPTDDDDEDLLPEAFDEEEQESLIRSLALENATHNAQYAKVLLSLPLLSVIPYIATLFTAQTAFFSLLSITSLLSTAYLLHSLPPGVTAIPFLDAWNVSAAADESANRIPDPLIQGLVDHGPVRKYLPYLNLALSAVLALLGLVFRGREFVWWGFAWLPGFVYGVVLLAKVVMGSVNPEMELGSLRYEFKGA